jgi:hypothetical protein
LPRKDIRWLPRWLNDRRERQRLGIRIREIDEEYRPRLVAAEDGPEAADVSREWDLAREEYEDALGSLRTSRLIPLARHWNVEIPANAWTTSQNESSYISGEGEVRLRRSIRDARREAAKWWVTVLTPVLSLLVALFSVILSLLSYLSRKP